MEDLAIRDLVTRLSRPHKSGGKVIERAAILAEGADSAEIVDWITDHAGRPEASIAVGHGGLHGNRLDDARASGAPLRYVLPAGALD
jgi:hypothetical protein